jgi:hypothetical protein
MPCLSLRVTIGALGALSVVIVAVVTLTIALTSSLSALRSVGEKHAAALLSNADSETAALFRSGTDAIESLVNVSLSRKWNWPSDDSNVYASYDALHHSVLLRAPDLSAVTTYFADNTRIAYARKSENADWANNFVASPYSRDAPNQTVLNDVRWFDVITHAPLPVTTTETILPYRVRENDLWGTFNLATFSSMFPNVYSPTVIPDFSPSGGNSPGEVSLPMIAPIYVYGATKGAANVFGYTTITMRLSRISDFLLASKSTPHSAGFVYDGINYLIGSSESVSYLTRRPLQKPVPTGCSSTEDLATALNGANITHHLMCRSSLTAASITVTTSPRCATSASTLACALAACSPTRLAASTDTWRVEADPVPCAWSEALWPFGVWRVLRRLQVDRESSATLALTLLESWEPSREISSSPEPASASRSCLRATSTD